MTEQKEENSSSERKMPFWDHLEELRWHLIRTLSAVIIGAVVAYFFSDQMFYWLKKPFPMNENLHFLNVTGAFFIKLKISAWAGFLFALPIFLWEMWRFIAPGLYQKEKKHVPTILLLTILCFLIGGSFAYFVVIPLGIQFLLEFAGEDLTPMITVDNYVTFIVRIIIAFGFVFEMPLLAFLFTKIGLLTPEFLRHYRAHAIVGMFVLAALLTPPDIMTQVALALPLLLLYEMSIWISKVFKPKSEFDD